MAATAVSAGGLVALLWAASRGYRWAILAKAIASLGFVAVALSEGAAAASYGRWVLIGLGLGLAGDILLELPASFLPGLGAFLLGHVAYMVAFAAGGPDWGMAAVGLAVAGGAGVVVAAWLWPHLPASLEWPVLAYLLVIVLMVAAAGGVAAARPLAALGAVAFFVSDVAVARDRFVKRAFLNSLWGLPLYYAGQLLIAWSV